MTTKTITELDQSLRAFAELVAESEEETPETPDEQVTPSAERLVDLAMFFSLIDISVGLGEDKLDSQANILAIQSMDSLVANVDKYLGPIMDLPGYKQFRRGSGGWNILSNTAKRRMEDHAARGRLILSILGKMQSRQSLLMDTFGQGLILQAAKKLGDMAALTDPNARLQALGDIKLAGSRTRTRRYVRSRIQDMGISVSDLDDTVSDVVQATELGAQLRAVEARIASTTDAGELGELRARSADIKKNVGLLAQDSANPETVISTVATEAAKAAQSYATDTGKLQGLSSDQEAAMLVRGKAVIAAGAGSGKCVRGDTLVSTPRGVMRIDQCSGQTAVVSVNADNLAVSTEIGTWLDMGTSPVYRVQTASGIEIFTTPEHPLLTWDGKAAWKCVRDMAVDDVLLLLPGHALEGGTRKVCADEAYLLGLWVGNANEYIIQKYIDLFERFSGKRPRTYHTDGRCPNHQAHGVESVNYLRRHGFWHEEGRESTNARTKSVPDWLMSSTALERISFLRGLFDTDGTATGGRGFEWLSASETLARQVHQMLIGLGVVGRLKPKFVKGYEDHTYWRVLVAGDQLRVFRDRIGFRYDLKKSSDLNALCDKPCNPNVGCYPHVGALLKEVRKEWISQGRWDGSRQALDNGEGAPWPSVKDYLLGGRAPSKDKLAALVKGCTSDAAQTLRSLTGYYPDPVVSCTLVGEERVYDFTVPTTHSFIANGIVSHNTRVLASKVAFHINELDVRPSQIIATSFSKKSAGELIDRVQKASGRGDLFAEPGSKDGFGTTHSISLKVCKQHLGTPVAVLENNATMKAIRKAMNQVLMRIPGGGSVPPPEPMGFFDIAVPTRGVDSDEDSAEAPAVDVPKPAASSTSYRDALRETIAWYERSGLYGNYHDNSKGFLRERLRSPDEFNQLSERRAAWVMKLFNQARVNFDPSATGPVSGATEIDAADFGEQVNWYNRPAGQWFNMGLPEDAWSDPKNFSRPVGAKQIGLFITNMKGRLITPSQALAQEVSHPMLCAAYGAYEWLLKNDEEFAGKMTFDDMLIKASGIMISNPSVLAKYRSRYKVILVDEAQDQNRAQHLFFGLIAGYIDPATQKPYVDEAGRPTGQVTADTFAFVGDDSQAIYAFRGATPDEFIELSTKHGFDTKYLKMNYRSGGNIVDSANKLIAHNTNRIPMVCEPMERKRKEGIVEHVNVEHNASGAAMMAQSVKEMVDEGGYSYKDFGVGCRTNAEAYDYVAACLENQIPFKTPPGKFKLFDNYLSKAIINWLRFAVATDTQTKNRLILDLHRGPQFNLKDVFNAQLQKQARGKDFLDYLTQGGWQDIYGPRQSFMARNAKAYTDALNMVQGMRDMAPDNIAQAILHDIKGTTRRDGEWVPSSLVDDAIFEAKRDDEIINTLLGEDVGSVDLQTALAGITDEQIKGLALAQAGPILGLLRSYPDTGSALAYLDKLMGDDKHLSKEDKEDRDIDAVAIDSIHGWKGLECKRMFVPMPKGTFPHAQSVSAGSLPDERRLAYVAITRAQEHLTVIVPKYNMAGKEAGPSQFIHEACIPPRGSEYTGVPSSDPPANVYTDEKIGEIMSSWAGDVETTMGWTAQEHLTLAAQATSFADFVLRTIVNHGKTEADE